MKQSKLCRISALLLALVMCLSMTVFAAGDAAMFDDVTEDEYFYEAVRWGLEQEITNGVGHNRFNPMGSVTRAQAVTFLWRMDGSPEPTITETFSDVVKGSWYETAVQWAVEQGITKGTGGNKFSPDLTCDRAMCLTMLYRMQDSPLDEAAAAEQVEITEDSTTEEWAVYMLQQMIEMFRGPELFPDVEQDSYYELAVVWGGMNGILTDDNTGTMEEGVKFRPDDPCIRSEMISFLYQIKLMEDRQNAPIVYDYDPISLAIPKEYGDQLYFTVSGVSEEPEGTVIIVSEAASVEAAEAMGLDTEGIGELFRVEWVSEDKAMQIAAEDIGGAKVFAKDEDGRYYVFCTPTDVRYVRETNEQMAEDQEQWIGLNEWASTVPNDILKYSEKLTPVTTEDGSSDALSLWTDDARAKTALTAYMAAITDPSSDDYIPVEDRIAVFDLDGTLFCETDPNYFDYTLLKYRVLDDPDYKDRASDFEIEVANKIKTQNETGESFPGLEVDHGKAVASAFAGMTVGEFNDYIQEFKKKPMPSYEGMTRGEGWYLPMLEIVEYLKDNDFTVYIVSGTDRLIVRGIVYDSPLDLPNRQIIGSDETIVSSNQGDTDGLNYVFTEGDELILGGDFLIKNLKMNKVSVIMQEIGQQPVLSFGNSTGDSSMAEYVTSGNPYRSLAFMLCCDDTVRENGSESKAQKMFELCEEFDWVPISMKNDWTTIYGDGVTKK